MLVQMGTSSGHPLAKAATLQAWQGSDQGSAGLGLPREQTYPHAFAAVSPRGTRRAQGALGGERERDEQLGRGEDSTGDGARMLAAKHVPGRNCGQACYVEADSQTCDLGAPGRGYKMQILRLRRDLLHQGAHFHRIPRWSART